MSAPKRARKAAALLPSDDFIGFASASSEHDAEDEEEEKLEEDENMETVRTEVDLPKAVPIDWSCSDLTMEFEMTDRGIILRHTLLPRVWALARGLRSAYQGRQKWHLEIVRLPKGSSSPNLLFGVLVQWPGCKPMPSPTTDVLDQPVLVLLADTGEQFFSSNLSPKLLRSPLFPKPLCEGDSIEIIADLNQRRLHFRCGEHTVEAKALPIRRDTTGPRGSRASNRLRETAYYPFVALQAGVEVQLSEHGPPLPRTHSSIEAIVLVGPPGAGKSTWAAKYTTAQGGHWHILGAEWFHQRYHFLEDQPKENAETVADQLGDAGRLELAERIIAAFSAFSEDLEVDDLCAAEAEVEDQNFRTSDLEDSREDKESQGLAHVLPEVLPELLQRAAARSVSVIADGCHLQASVRAKLRAALLRFPGRVRWVVVIPNTLQELLERQGRTAGPIEHSSTLPGGDPNCAVEFAEGGDKVFHQWLAQVNQTVATSTSQVEVSSSQSLGMHSFFTNFGNYNGYLSTEGIRRY